MFVEYKAASLWYESLVSDYKYPTLDPRYIQLEAKQGVARRAAFYLIEHGDFFFYLGGYITSVGEIMDFETPRGYGGVLTNISDQNMLAVLRDECEMTFFKKGVLCAFIRNIPLFDNHLQLGLESWRDRETIAIDLSVTDLLQSYKTRTRTAIRKAQKNLVTIREAQSPNDWRDFAELYQRRMHQLCADSEYLYSLDYFLSLADYESAHLYLAERDGELLAGCIILRQSNISEYHLSASTQSGMKYAATQACVHFSAEDSQSTGTKYMHLGGGLTDEDNDPLLFFKQGFSNCRFSFYISRWIFNQDSYCALKDEYRCNGKPVNRVIFYR